MPLVAFCLSPLSSCADYNTPPLPPSMQNAQIPICMNPSSITQSAPNCLSLVSSSSPPAYLELFNEPDYSYADSTPLTSPSSAAAAITPLLPYANTTTFISPAPAFTNSDYLSQFFASCGAACNDTIDIIAAHVYSPDPDAAVKQITDLHAVWPGKKIWVTEISPASGTGQGCEFDEEGMVGWMQSVLGRVKGLGYVEKVFWNCGEYVSLFSSSYEYLIPSPSGFLSCSAFWLS